MYVTTVSASGPLGCMIRPGGSACFTALRLAIAAQDDEGNELNPGAEVEITIEADQSVTTPKIAVPPDRVSQKSRSLSNRQKPKRADLALPTGPRRSTCRAVCFVLLRDYFVRNG